jgi:hypothetical protein
MQRVPFHILESLSANTRVGSRLPFEFEIIEGSELRKSMEVDSEWDTENRLGVTFL